MEVARTAAKSHEWPALGGGGNHACYIRGRGLLQGEGWYQKSANFA